MGALAVFSADSLTAWRAVLARVREHPLMTVWFAVLAATATWVCLRVAELVASGAVDAGPLSTKPQTLLLVFFFIIMGKSVVDANARCTQNREMTLLLSQPLPVGAVLLGKLAFIALSNLTVLALCIALATAVHAALTPGLYVPPWLVAALIPLALLASVLGFLTSVVTSQPRFVARVAGVALLSQLVAALYISCDALGANPVLLLCASVLLLCAALACLPVAARLFLPAWNHEVSGAEGLLQRATRMGSGRVFRALTKRLDPATRELLRKEIVINISRKEVGGTLFTIVGVGVVLVYMRGRVGGGVPGSPLPPLVIPLLVCIGLYISAVLLHALLGLGSLGKEGRSFWILKHLPVESERVFRAKAGALMTLAPFALLSVAVPLPLLSGMSPLWVAFFILAWLALALACTAVGIWSGTVYPNFDEGTRGSPDVMTMYLVMMACLVLGAVLVGLPGLVMSRHELLGVLSMALSADWGALLLEHAISRSARNYEVMEVGV
ncbi:MAG: putative ABC transporter permease subunit [Thermoplasmatota archaeon]